MVDYPHDDLGAVQRREPGWYWVLYPPNALTPASKPQIAYCHGTTWNGLTGALDERHFTVVSPRIPNPTGEPHELPLEADPGGKGPPTD